jgi:tetratricopeptide (TPR) repeat protein
MIALLLAATVAAPHLFPVGDWHHKISSKKKAAQQYFDHGLAWSYAFNRDEAIADFAEAARRDPTCAICLWGEALNLGGDINFPPDPEREARATKLIEEARKLANKASDTERAYIDALAVRYTTGVDGRVRAEAYAKAMAELAKKLPNDADAQVLAAEAQMDLRPWALWKKDGSPEPGTEEIVATLKKALARWPKHPGANHLCIHALEGSAHPDQASVCAQRLPSLVPSAGHLVHMPAHIWMRVGRYADASEANERAIRVDQAYLAKTRNHGPFSMMYAMHNFQFLWASAAMEGRSQRSIWAATQLDAKNPDPMVREMEKTMPGIDFVRGPRLFAFARFGLWGKLVDEPAPPKDFKAATAYWRFAHGLALARTGKVADAKAELAALRKDISEVPKEMMFSPTNAASDVLEVAAGILDGEIARTEGRLPDAIAALQKAVEHEDTLGYDEPPTWPLPAREYLGSALLEAKRAKDAEAAYREDLVRNPENGWALFGLTRALEAQQSPDAKQVEARFAKAWAHADVKLTDSRF